MGTVLSYITFGVYPKRNNRPNDISNDEEAAALDDYSSYDLDNIYTNTNNTNNNPQINYPYYNDELENPQSY